MNCPNCQQINDSQARFCSKCGQPLMRTAKEKVSLDEKCPKLDPEEDLSTSRMDRHHRQGINPEALQDKPMVEEGDPEEAVAGKSLSLATRMRKVASLNRYIGLGLIILAFLTIFLTYQLNFSSQAIEKHFVQSIKRTDYLKAAGLVQTPLTDLAWTDKDLERTLNNYQEAGIDFPQLLSEGDLKDGLKWQGQEIAKLEKMGVFIFFFPRYRVNLKPISVDLSLSNDYRKLKIIAPGQKEQALSSNQGIQIEPRFDQVYIQYEESGQKHELLMDLDYQKLASGRHVLSLVPVTNRIQMDKGLLGIRPNLSFDLLSFNIDGQEYDTDQVDLSGFVGQSFQVSFKANYNGHTIQSQPASVKLIKEKSVRPDFRKDQELQAQIRQAELN